MPPPNELLLCFTSGLLGSLIGALIALECTRRAEFFRAGQVFRSVMLDVLDRIKDKNCMAIDAVRLNLTAQERSMFDLSNVISVLKRGAWRKAWNEYRYSQDPDLQGDWPTEYLPTGKERELISERIHRLLSFTEL